MTENGSLITKYRPATLDEVVGQDAVVKSLRGVLKRRSSHAFIFEGPAGTGKTSLARIVATEMGCSLKNITEVDAATATGIDAMREVTASMIYAAIGEDSNKAYIIDEAHRLSPGAWASLLKPVEEPPPHVFWAFCTTEGSRIPVQIRTRCAQYQLKRVSTDVLFDLLKRVAQAENIQCPDEVLDLCAGKADGSPRAALSLLAACARCKTRQEAADLAKVALADEGTAQDLCRLILKGASWSSLMWAVKELGDVNAENVRYAVLGYFSKVAMGAKDDRTAQQACAVLDVFGDPYPQGTTVYPIILSLGRLMLVK